MDNITLARTPEGKVNCAAYAGLEGLIEDNELYYPVEVRDARIRYGHLDLLVSPKNGKGERWVQRSRVYLSSDPAANN